MLTAILTKSIAPEGASHEALVRRVRFACMHRKFDANIHAEIPSRETGDIALAESG